MEALVNRVSVLVHLDALERIVKLAVSILNPELVQYFQNTL